MDLTTLIRNNVDALRANKERFDAAHDPAQRKQAYDSFVDAITNLHKVLKGADLPKEVQDKMLNMVTMAAKDATQMKEALANNTAAAPVNGAPSMGKTASNESRENALSKKESGRHDKPNDNDKDKAAFQEALQGAIITEKPNVKWEDVAGLKIAKQTLKEAIIFPTKFPDIFVGLRKPWKGILLYGVNSPAARHRQDLPGQGVRHPGQLHLL